VDLRPYQHEMIDAARDRMRLGSKRTLLVLPTGGGKTVVAAAIISAAESKGSRVLFLAHRRELISQTADKLLRFGVQPGVILAGEPKALHRSVQVASVQTLIRRPGELGQVDLIFVDEAHHLVEGNTYDKLLEWWPGARVVGLTATPWRLDGAGLADVFDSHVLVRTPRQLRDEGYLVPVTGWEYAPVNTRSARVKGGDFDAKSMEQAAMSKTLFGEIIGDWKAHAGGVRTVLFGCTVAHSAAMAQAFVDAGVPAEHLDGETPKDKRAAILSRLRSGDTRVLCNVNVATEGWDCPELECVILARPTLSTSLYLQMVGRVLRPSEGKATARIHDHARCLAAHGHPYADRDYSPEKSSGASRKEVESTVRRDKRCPSCSAVVVTWPCDGCHHMPEPKEIEVQRQAERRAITDTPGWAKVRAKAEEDAKRARRWAQHTVEEKRQLFLRMVEKHGPKKAVGVYRWLSGETEWPPRSWRLDGAEATT
jgi:DNA repair protein RadD